MNSKPGLDLFSKVIRPWLFMRDHFMYLIKPNFNLGLNFKQLNYLNGVILKLNYSNLL